MKSIVALFASLAFASVALAAEPAKKEAAPAPAKTEAKKEAPKADAKAEAKKAEPAKK